MNEIDIIIESYINGNKRQMVNQIDNYSKGHYDFWNDLKIAIESKFAYPFELYSDICITYNRILNR